MAKVKDIFGAGISGKVGKVVFFQLNGQTFARGLPKRQNHPGTPAQELNRKRFREMQKFSQQFKFVLIPQVWNFASKTMSGHQLFMSTNNKAFSPDGSVIDPKLIKLSVGKLSLPSSMTVKRLQPGSNVVQVSWVEEYYNGGVPYWDELLAISSGEGFYSEMKNTGIRRGDQQGSFELPALEVDATHIYLFFGAIEKSKYTESMCFELDVNGSGSE
ncbi:MAG TPA: hypothetical protein VFG54_09795 [Prolixibacteraceae bacterium]|nr:hypothetical protein [Prolixibacteraceae bacterium]